MYRVLPAVIPAKLDPVFAGAGGHWLAGHPKADPETAWSYQWRFRALVSTSYPSPVTRTLSSKSPT